MNCKSTQIALGGVFSALCVLLMFMTGMIPFSMYILPAVAGAMLVAVVVENGTRTAVLVYASVSLLSLFTAPDREAAVLFILFFGYYPILKSKLERVRPRCLEYLVKLGIFAAAMVLAYLASLHILGLEEAVEGMEEWGRYGGLILLLFGCGVFVVYDFALTRYIGLYIHWFKPTFLRR